MKKIFLLCIAAILSMSVFAKTWTITNSGNSFSPSTLTVQANDTISFNLENFHNAIEVSKATWDAKGNAKLSGGFELDFGGGTLLVNSLAVGTHYFVCAPHAAMGMKGSIVVNSIATAIRKTNIETSIFPNPAEDYIRIKSSNLIGSAINIIDPTGRIIKNGSLTSEDELLDIKDLHSGLYFIQIAGNESITLKFKKK